MRKLSREGVILSLGFAAEDGIKVGFATWTRRRQPRTTLRTFYDVEHALNALNDLVNCTLLQRWNKRVPTALPIGVL